MTRRGKAGISFAAGGVAALGLLLMAYIDSRDPSPVFPLPLLVVTGLAAVILFAVGASLLAVARRVAAGAPEEKISYRHTYRLFGLLGILFLVLFTARSLAVPSDYGLEGPFRAGARRDAANVKAPRYQGRDSCVKCHQTENAETAKDVHHTVQCEDCHGPSDQHNKDPKQAHLTTDRSQAACLICHRKLTARPGAFPQIAVADHFKLVGVKDEKTECVSCHDAHQPIFLQKPLAEARLHPLVHRCRDCHLNRTDETLKRPENHPAIFQCGYCHTKIATDFTSSTHSKIACTTCHLFVKDSDFAGRIVRNTDPRFCLLCHRAAPFRAEGGPPTIDWDEHRKTFDDTLDERAPCAQCHADALHGELAAAGGPAK